MCLKHGYNPSNRLVTVIIPTLKNNNEYLNDVDANNFRPTALATILSKLFRTCYACCLL